MKFHRYLSAILAVWLLAFAGYSPAIAAATLLPNAEQCFQALAGTNGMVGLLGAITGGSGGTAGTYGGVALTGGSGSGATANITVAGGGVTAVAILNPGSAYVVGDVLSAAAANIGNTTGFSVPVSSISINTSLAGGKVYFYYPNTSTFKQTWFDADQSASHQNTNPVILDSNGCAVVYGIGSYRQVLQDSLGNTVWDQITTDTSANNNTFWAGLSGGTPNVITVVDTGFNATDGSIINFMAIATNTGTTTLNPSSFGAVPILKDTTAGPVSLIGGEIIQNNTVSVIYRAQDGAFHLLNPPIQSASGSTAPLCGAVGFKAATSGSYVIVTTANNAVMVSGTGASINRSSVSVTANLQTIGANGLDTGAIAANTVYYLWLIDNGAAPAALASLSATTPALPSGYSYKCRLGAIPTDSSAHLYGTTLFGNQAVISSINVSSVLGTCFSTMVAFPFTQLPPTATFASIRLQRLIGSGNSSIGVGSSAGPLFETAGSDGPTTIIGNVPLSTPQQVTVCNSDTGNSLTLLGWTDSVNAY